jgi:hypothetical protein
VAALTDQGWTDICAEAGRTPDDDVRAELSAIFDEYPGFAYDRERRAHVLASADRAERMLEHLDAYAADHQAQFTRAEEIKTDRDRFYIRRLRWRALSLLDAARALSHAHGGHSNVQQEMLYTRLCTIWLYGFGKPKLTTTRGGPLVRFRPRKAYARWSQRRKPGDAHTIQSFCESNAISESKYRGLKRKGKGPREIDLDGRIIISPEAEIDWRREREAETTAKRQAKAEKKQREQAAIESTATV